MTSYTAIFLFLFNKGQTHKTKGEGQKALQGDAGTLVLGYWLRSIIYKPIVVPYYPVHSLSTFTGRRLF